MNRILIAEDETRIAAFLEKGLRANGYTTIVVRNGIEAAQMASCDDFDLMILDLGLPGKEGLVVLEEMRGRGERLPVIILTARDDIADKVAGLESGADDYVTKPFRFEELLARVRARLRDTGNGRTQEQLVLRSGEISLDLRTRKVSAGGVPSSCRRANLRWQRRFCATRAR